MKIDIHTHIFPDQLPDLAARYGEAGFVQLEAVAGDDTARNMTVDGQFFRRVECNCYDPAARIRECDADRVDVQVLSTVPIMFAYWAKPASGADLAKLLNDHIAGVVAADPGRFLGLGTVPMQDPDHAIAEAARCVEKLGMPGIQIGSHVNGVNLGDPRFDVFWEAIAAMGCAVFVHPWDMVNADRFQKYWLKWLVGMPAETTVAICSMIFAGVFERHPALRVCFAHGGGAFPFTLGRIEHGHACRPDLCAPDNAPAPSSYLGRFWVDSLVHDAAALRFLIERMGLDKVCLGTDYPFPLGEHHPGELIESLDTLSEADKSRLLAGNALDFLKLDATHFAPR